MIFSFNPKVNLYTAFWCFFLGLKLCPNISGLGELKKRRSKFDSLAIRCLVFLLNRCNFIFFQNSSDLEVLVDLGLKNSNVKVLFGSGVDLSKFPSQTVIKRTFDSPRLNIFMASRLIKDKGVEEFIKLANAFDKDRAKFFLAGVPDYSSRRIDGDLLNNSVSSGCLQFLGNINNVHEIMLSMDIFILPSRYSEGLPKSLLEACAAGMIIITSDSPGCSDVIKAGAGGILCKPQVDELFHALELLLNKPSVELKEMSINSRSIAEKHGDVHSNIQEYLKVVNSLC